MKRYLVLVLILFAVTPVFAQLRPYPIYTNKVLKQFLAARPGYTWNQNAKLGKVGFLDTLDLPFFDDFSQNYPYPDSSRWADNQVYVNADFGINPPSVGVASFDNLNEKGNPYSELNAGVTGRSDSLTSQSIRLDSFPFGLNRIAATLADSIYLSFFCQPQGYSFDPLDTTDALTLEFKRTDGSWVRVWRKTGGPIADFSMVLVPVNDIQYLHNSFQFRFVNYAHNSGFSNLWHVDYVRLDRNRSAVDTLIKDVAIRETPSSLLSTYRSMSWKQFKANPAGEKAANHGFRVHNMDQIIANVAFQCQSFDQLGNTIFISDFASNNDNIQPRADLVYSFSNFNFDNLTGKPVVIKSVYSIDNAASNQVAINDNYTVYQVFDDYLAYDDGTAEQGLGLDYGSVPPNSLGQVAVKFHLNTPDTLTAISAFFTQATKDVSASPFQLRIWQSITPGTNTATMLRAVEMVRPPYTDSLNGFSYTYLADSFVILPAGDFYLGWGQNFSFFLNIGLDRGYRVNGADVENPNLYYNLYGEWEAADVKGAPMIRPVFNREQPVLSVKPVHANSRHLQVYPNPSRDEIYWTGEAADGEYTIMDMTGKVILQGKSENRHIYFGNLPAGFYVLHLKDSQKQVTYTQKLVVNP